MPFCVRHTHAASYEAVVFTGTIGMSRLYTSSAPAVHGAALARTSGITVIRATRKGMAKKRPLMKSPPTETVYATYNAAETAARRAAPGARHANISDKATVPSVIGSWLMLLST